MSCSLISAAAPVQLRALTVADVPEVLRIQALCYGAEYVEGAAVFTRRLASAHQRSWAAVRQGQLVAYLAAYPSLPGKITPLQGDFAVAAEASVLYLHDMAVQPDMAGQRIAAQLLHAALTQARAQGLQRAALVAVQGAQRYWAHKGFVPSAPADAQQIQHLRGYGLDACYMELALQG